MHDLPDQERHAEIMGMDEREEGLDRLAAGRGQEAGLVYEG